MSPVNLFFKVTQTEKVWCIYQFVFCKDHYVNMLQNFFLPQLQNKAPDILGNMWFQQDGAKCYTIQPVMAFLRQTFGNRIISWFSDVPGPHQSLHLTAPEFFLRGYLKEQVYRRHPHTQLQLAHRIQHANEAITDNTLVAAMNNVIHQCYSCANS
jgi:hypothetical protein